MFKPLLRTLPTLSGNFTIACKLREIDKENNNEYSTYVRLANMVPLQNFMANKDYELNLLDGKYEYDVSKYHYYYSDVFYKHNYTYNKNNYTILDLNSIYNYNNDSRNKDYEFGCKRIQYSQNGSQFNFYAPIYIDNVNDLPEYFQISIVFNDHLTKTIKVYINKDNKRNYLKNYLTRYLKQIDERVIFCLQDSLQATYFGIDINNGGIEQYKDNLFGDLYVSQKTINNFDYTICKGFERNHLIMRQIIPLSFSFNINDLFNNYEREFFTGAKFKIFGHYYTKGGTVYDMYDFDINYTTSYSKYKKYNSYTGLYDFVIGKDSDNKNINIMDVGYPALNESKYTKYAYTNKITPMYCKFKMMLSDDNNPYITNVNFAYSYNQYPNQKYGEFPTMFKGLFPKVIIDHDNLKLPIGTTVDMYYKTVKNVGNKIITNTNNIDKYNKLMSNYCSSWYNVGDYNPDFNNDTFINNFFKNSKWSDIKYGYTYFNGILYNLKELGNIDKFGVFCGAHLNYLSEQKFYDSLVKADIVLSSETSLSGNKIYNYNQSYNMKLYDKENNIEYYNKIIDISLNNFTGDNVKINQNMIKDLHGTYVIEENYLEENMYFKVSDILSQFKYYFTNKELSDKIVEKEVNGFEILEAYNNINFFEEVYTNIYSTEKTKQFMLIGKTYDTQEYINKYHWLYDALYYTNQLTTNKYKVSEYYNSIYYNEDINGKMCMFIKDKFIHKNDLINILYEHTEDLSKFSDLNQLLRTYFNYLVENSSSHHIDTIDDTTIDNWVNQQLGDNIFNELKNHYAYNQFKNILNDMINMYNKNINAAPIDIQPKEEIKGNSLIFLVNYLSNMQSYKFEALGNKNGIDINDYFVKNELNEKNIYVDPYNLKEYISLYNRSHSDNKIQTSFIYKKFFSNILNKDHLIEFYNKLKNSENDYNSPLIHNNLLDIIYVKERCWYIEKNKISIKDRYITLYEYLYKKFVELGNDGRSKYKQYKDAEDKKQKRLLENNYLSCLNEFFNYFIYLHKSKDNGIVLDWLTNSLSEMKSNNNKFIFNVQLNSNETNISWDIELDLCIYKNMVLLDNNLRKLISNGYFLYLFITDKTVAENLSMWPIISNDNLVNNENYIYKEIDDYLSPLFTDIYFNESDLRLIQQMIDSNKINSNNKYIVSSNKYFKEIDVDESFKSLLINNDKNIYDIVNDINNLYDEYNYLDETFVELKESIANSFNFDYFIFKEHITDISSQKLLLDNFFNNRNNISETEFNNNYKDIFEELIEDTITGLNDPKLSEGNIYYIRLQDIYDTIVSQYNIFIYLNTLELHTALNNINKNINGIITDLSSDEPKINNIPLLNTEHLDNTLDIINTLNLKYINNIVPLFNSIKNDFKTLFNINSNFKNSISNYSLNNLTIDTLMNNKELFIEYLYNSTFSINWINEIISVENYDINSASIFKDKWNDYCLSNEIYVEDINKDNYENIIDIIIRYIKTYYNESYYKLINNKGIILYSLSNVLDMNYDNLVGDKLQYNDKYKIYTYDYNGKKYAFYYININVDNTNNSFNVLNEFNLSVKFDAIDDIKISDSRFDSFFNKIFYLLEPFLRLNIFNEFTKNISTIVYPYEAELNIEYMSSATNDDNIKKQYKLLANDGALYDNIIKMSKSRKIKLLRYFNYITPLLVKTHIIQDNWELQFIDSSNNDLYVKKYNILNKDNVNIYRYNGIKYYNGRYSKAIESFVKDSEIEQPTMISQYEYKHFNDNTVYNLPEDILITDDKYYTYDEISKYKENRDKIEEEKKNILLKYFDNLGLDYSNIILFLFNKYDSNMTIEPIKLRANKTEKLYKVSYKFKLV